MTRGGAGRLLLLVVAWLGAAPAAADSMGVVERSRLEIKPSGRGFTQLAIDNPLGDVRIEGYEGTALQIETRKHAPDQDALDRLRVSLVPNPDGTVRITTTADAGVESRAVARGAVRIDLIVRAPRGARIEATASAGTLEMSNMDAGGELDTGSGRILVRNVSGELSTHTVSGLTSLSQVFGSIDAQSLSSDLDLDSVAGAKLVASVNDGKIAGRRVRSRSVELTTVNGTIVLEGEVGLHGRIVVASLRGDLDVRLRRTGAVLVRARAAKVNLGAAPALRQVGGWIESHLGTLASVQPALVEMRSRLGTVTFAIVE